MQDSVKYLYWSFFAKKVYRFWLLFSIDSKNGCSCCIEYRNFTQFPEFKAICPKLWGNHAFPQNFHTRKLGEISVFYVVT